MANRHVPAKELPAFYGPSSAPWRDPETRHVRTPGSEVTYQSEGPKHVNVIDNLLYTIAILVAVYLTLTCNCPHAAASQ